MFSKMLIVDLRYSFKFNLLFGLMIVIASSWLNGCQTTRSGMTSSGVAFKRLKKGSGAKAKPGQEILLFETTSYRNGTVLYSNEHTTTPVKVLIGGNQATHAVDEALVGMKAGEIKEITAPPNTVKRKSYPPNVHPDSTLVIKLILNKIL